MRRSRPYTVAADGCQVRWDTSSCSPVHTESSAPRNSANSKLKARESVAFLGPADCFNPSCYFPNQWNLVLLLKRYQTLQPNYCFSQTEIALTFWKSKRCLDLQRPLFDFSVFFSVTQMCEQISNLQPGISSSSLRGYRDAQADILKLILPWLLSILLRSNSFAQFCPLQSNVLEFQACISKDFPRCNSR